MIVRYPGVVAGGRPFRARCSVRSTWPVTFLSAAGIEVPGLMQGLNQLEVWGGDEKQAREWVLVENRHNPTTVHLRTLVTDRYKITVYRDAPYGELFDLEKDPAELHNCWDDPLYAGVKAQPAAAIRPGRDPARANAHAAHCRGIARGVDID